MFSSNKVYRDIKENKDFWFCEGWTVLTEIILLYNHTFSSHQYQVLLNMVHTILIYLSVSDTAEYVLINEIEYPLIWYIQSCSSKIVS